MAKEIINYRDTDEYSLLVDDCQSTITEGVFRSRQELIETYKELGKRIYTDSLYKKWGQNSQGKFMQQLAQDIGKSIQVLYYSTQFYYKLINDKEFSTAVEKLGKNASWNKIRALLPEPKEKQIPLPKGKYQVIYADPPWQYAQEQHSHKRQDTVLETHYPTMSIEDICKLPVGELTGENAVLFLWTTSPKLFECKPVIDAWGFDYKSSMIWDKVKHNVGYYVSVRHEFLLICTKGSCLPDNPKLYDSVIIEERTEHSKKPEIFYDIIEDIYKGKKIELFARNSKKRKGWDYWGDESDEQ